MSDDASGSPVEEKESISPKTLLILGLLLVGLVGGGFYASEVLWTPKPPGAEPIPHLAVENEAPPARAAPAAGTLDEKVRGYFQNIGTRDCMMKHLPKDSKVDGVAEFNMQTDGAISDVQVKTEPNNAGVALCVQGLLARGFSFEGQPVHVSYTFNGKWDEQGRLSLGQNTSLAQ